MGHQMQDHDYIIMVFLEKESNLMKINLLQVFLNRLAWANEITDRS